MKFIIVTIHRGTDPNKAAMQYPTSYNAQEVELNKRGPILYEGGLSRGEDTEECLLYVTDALATKYSSVEARIKIVSDLETNAWLAANQNLQNQPEERITDSNRLELIKIKLLAGQVLTTEDNAVLDPDNPIRGVNRVQKTVAGIFGV